MPDPDEARPEAPAGDDQDRPDGPADRPADEAAAAHDPSGLGLARSVAASLGATARTARRGTTRARGGAPRRVGPGPQVSGAHPDDRDPQRLGAAVERLVESRGWTTEVDVRSLLARWAALVGPVNAAHSHPESYVDTVLTVRTDSTAWATQLRLMAPQLVALLNGALGDGTVTRVTVRGPGRALVEEGPAVGP